MSRLVAVSACRSDVFWYSQVQCLGVKSCSLILECRDDCDESVETVAQEEVSDLLYSANADFLN
jgi:hypothetical protein